MRYHSSSWFLLSAKATADIRYEALVLSIAFTTLASCMVVLRLWARLSSRSISTEDYLVTVALILSIGYTGIVGGEFSVDGGYIKSDRVRIETLSTMLKLAFTQSIFYHISINLVKISFVLQYLKLFSHIRPISYYCYMLFVAIAGTATWGIFGVIFLCKPINNYWNLDVSGTCFNAEIHFKSTSILGIVLDWAIWLMPMPVVSRLKLPRRQKGGVLVVFGLGGFVCMVSILRLVLVLHFAHRGKVSKSGTYALVWSTLEMNIAIICASLLVMKPLFARFMPALVTEQAMSAREDARLWRGITGLSLLRATVSEVEKTVDLEDGRRDTVISAARQEMGTRSGTNATETQPTRRRSW